MSLNKIFKIFGYFVSVVLIIFGTILVTGIPPYAGLNKMPDQSRIAFGVVFLLYGIYRGVRLFFSNKDIKSNKETELEQLEDNESDNKQN